MRSAGGTPVRVVAAAAVLLLSGCTTALQPAAPASESVPARSLPPLAADLRDGVPVDLGAQGHWVIEGARAFAAADGGIDGIDLTTGAVAWHVAFPSALAAWDAEPTVGLTEDGATVLALRTVDSPTGAALELLSIEATTGRITDSRIITPPGRWVVTLPPRILAADATSIVVADDPEVGSRVGAVTRPSGVLAWHADDQGFAAADTVITRSGVRDRLTGEAIWQSESLLGPLVGETADVVVAEVGSTRRVVWLDRHTGTQVAAVEAESETCVAAAAAVICLGGEVTGYDLASGARLWARPGNATAVTTYQEWAYLWRDGNRGDVLDSRSGEVVVRDAELPQIRYGNEAGILVHTDGYAWVPAPR